MNDGHHGQIPVAAQSLVNLHHLADYPLRERQGRSSSKAPLVLYVYKIPGRSDFCLSIHKPLGDSVTAEDITQALYIVHVETLDEIEERRILLGQSTAQPTKIARKPVPPPRNGRQIDVVHARDLELHESSGEDGLSLQSKPTPRLAMSRDQSQKRAIDIPITTVLRYDSTTTTAKPVARFLDPDHPYSKPLARRARPPTADIFLDIANPNYEVFGRSVNYCSESDQLSFTRRMWREEDIARQQQPSNKFDDELEHRRSMNLASDWQSFPSNESPHVLPRSHGFSGARAGAGYVFQSPWTARDFFVFSTNRRGTSMECHLSSQAGGNLLPELFAASELRFNLPTLSFLRPSSSSSESQPRRESVLSLSRLSQHFSDENMRRNSHTPTAPTSIGSGANPNRHSMFEKGSLTRSSMDGSSSGGSRLSFSALKRRLANMTNDAQSFSNSGTNEHPSHDGRMDLKLAKERLGGGFSGDKAKLAKLIINDRGQDVLDLMVAANVALFLRAYNLMDNASSEFQQSGEV